MQLSKDSKTSRQLYIASKNAHKTSELRQMLSHTDFDVRDLSEFSDYVSPEETGKTFLENARLKANATRDYLKSKKITDAFVLADDSGLECEDLKGAPGIFSARFAGENASDAQNNTKLVSAIQTLPHPTRVARFVCSLVLLAPDGTEKSIEESCDGVITFAATGGSGFGYDPHFYLPELGKTMAELKPDEKNQISHRGKALRNLLKYLESK